MLIAGLVVIVVLLAGPDARNAAGHYPDPYTSPTAPTASASVASTTSPTGSRTSTTGTGTPTTTVSRARTPTLARSSGNELATQTALANSATETPEETSTPTLTPTPLGELQCPPGVPVEINGEGPPRAPYLLYFGDRVVSGGSVEPDGRFSIALIVGNEREGTYEVTVRVRGTPQVLRRLTCTVPPTTPTPLPTYPLR